MKIIIPSEETLKIEEHFQCERVKLKKGALMIKFLLQTFFVRRSIAAFTTRYKEQHLEFFLHVMT